LGNRSAEVAPQGCYRCAGDDEWCAISVQDDAQWRALVAALGEPAWGQDDRFATLAGRLRYHDELDAHLTAWTGTLAPRVVEERLRLAGVPAARMRRIRDVVDEPEGPPVFHPLEDPPGWEMRVTGLPFAFSRHTLAPLRPAPRLGEHTEAVLAEWTGLTDGEIASLQAAGALA
jgi:crotonobetainyl-CoA:carnitine CoA-transferase CaiB-like acyl-CoA transferase